MKTYLWNQNKFGTAESTTVPRAFHSALRERVRSRFQASGLAWADFVFGSSNAGITAADCEAVERELLASGYRFDVSATISAKEAPEKYKDLQGQDEAAIAVEEVKDGRQRVGLGDNVVTYPATVTGTALYVHTAEEVMALMMDGVPADSIAVIDDSGGTLTAPILEQFKAVVCMGGTVRSHLGILCREYGIPCLMNAKVAGIRTGDRLEVDYAAPAKTALDYQSGVEKTADVWKLI